MTKFKVLRGFCYEAGRDVYPGEVIEIAEGPPTKARIEQLLLNQKIVPVNPSAPAVEAEAPAGEAETEGRRRR